MGCAFSGYLVGVRLALRARFVFISLGVLSLVALAAYLSAQFSGRQPASVALDVGISVIRFALPLVAVLVTQEVLSKEFEGRYFLVSLSYPRARYYFLWSRFAAIFTLGCALLFLSALVLAIVVWLVSLGYEQSTPVALGWLFWLSILFVALDLLVLVSFAVFLAVSASTSSFVLVGVLGFMLVARSYSAVIELLMRSQYVVADAEVYRQGVSILSYMIPDLGSLDVRMVAIYNRIEFLPVDWLWRVCSCLIYVSGLLALSMFLFKRKRFS